MNEIAPLRKFVNPEIVYGVGALSLAGQYAPIFEAKRVLLVTDPGVMTAGWGERVIASLNEAGVECIVYSSVSPNPRDTEVMTGAELFRQEGCSAIVVVGGGSPIDCAKGIGIVCTNRCHILDFKGVDRVTAPMPPLICIPTTAGSSADVSQFAIINNTAECVKIAIISKSVVPDVSLIDPLTTTTMDPYLTACTGFDALSHAVEAYVSNASSPLTDLHALQAIRLIVSNLSKAVVEPHNLEARNNMMLASLEAGLAFSNASLGAVHAMSHSLGGILDLSHGECNAMLLEHVIRYNHPAAAGRYRDVAEAMGIPVKELGQAECLDALLAVIRELHIKSGITDTLGKKKVMSASIPALAEKAMQDACMVTNPRRPTTGEIEGIYAQAL